jgi:hypothetical protein
MNQEPETSIYENAAMMVDACRSEYQRLGFEDAENLRGVEVTDARSAELALMLIDMLPTLASTAAVRRCTIDSLEAVLRAEEQTSPRAFELRAAG